MQRTLWTRMALFLLLAFGSGVFFGLRWSNEPFFAPLLSLARQEFSSKPAEKNTVAASVTREMPLEARPGGALVIADDAPEQGQTPPVEPSEEAAKEAVPALDTPAEFERDSPPSELADNAKGDMPAGDDAPSLSQELLPFAPSLSSLTWHKLGNDKGPVLLIVGGIQGDEPGGFSAASLIASQYTITDGSVWVVPGLNLRSILQRNRGVFGDLNRKFAAIDPNDPEYELVAQIKALILDEKVGLVLNLHDGSGFYRPVYEDAMRNPGRWGQSLIIDQETMPGSQYSLRALAREVETEVNQHLLDPMHRYHIHNTRTGEGNVEMSKTLSWFAVQNGKPALGIEASKEFGTENRTYYHLRVIEAFMRRLGITYERDFPLNPKGVLAALNSNLKVAAYDNRIVLDLENARPALNMVPFKKNETPDVRATKPLLTLVPDQKQKNWRVAYGNRTLTRVHPEFMDFDDSLDSVSMILDGEAKTVRLGEIVSVSDSFLVKGEPGFRVNAIGAQKEKNGTEANVELAHKDFMPRFSVDKNATTYRVEVYKGNAFTGMVLVKFGQGAPAGDEALTATKGPESALGF